MKKIIFALLISVCLSVTNISYAADYIIKDIQLWSYGYMALTDDGVVFNANYPTSTKKEVIATEINSISKLKGLFVDKNNNINFNTIKINDVEEIICVSENRFWYIGTDKSLYRAYTQQAGETVKLVDNIKDYAVYGVGLFVRDNQNNLYYQYGDKNNFVSTDVFCYDGNYYMDSQGKVYNYKYTDNVSVLAFENADVNKGLSNSVFFSDGKFLNHNRHYGMATEEYKIFEYPCSYGVKQMVNKGYIILYIGNDGYLYKIKTFDIRNAQYLSYNAVVETKISDNIKFEKLYKVDEYVYALDTNNNLYTLNYISGTDNNNYNYDYLLGECIENAVPKKAVGGGGNVLMLTTDGRCYAHGAYGIHKGYGYKNTVFDTKDILLKINDNKIELKSVIQRKNGRTMYPMRECLEALGASVQWDGINNIAIGQLPGIKVEFPIGKNEYYVNGVKHTMDATTYVDASIGRTYIPIRYAAEGLGFTVDWIEGGFENIINIHK